VKRDRLPSDRAPENPGRGPERHLAASLDADMGQHVRVLAIDLDRPEGNVAQSASKAASRAHRCGFDDQHRIARQEAHRTIGPARPALG